MNVTHHYAVVNGVRLHYVEAGTGRPIILLHGFPEFWYSWRFQIPALASGGFRVVAPDLRGYNQSAKPAGLHQYRLEALRDDVAGLIQHLGARRAIVVGHDWGGGIAWHVARDLPGLVERLIILNAPHPAAFLREMKTLTQIRRSWYIFFFQLPWVPEVMFRAFDYAVLRRTLHQGPVRRGAFTEDDIACYKAAISEPGALTAALNYYRAAFRTLRHAPTWAQASISIPTLVIWGERDPYLGVALLKGLDRWVSNLQIERISDGSHWVQIDAHDQVTQSILQFLKQ